MTNKKVLLRERKRHTARCVANTPYVVLTGYPPGGGGGPGTPPGGVREPPWGGLGTTPPGVPGQVPRGCGNPPGGSSTPPGGVPSQVPGGVQVPTRGGYPVRYPGGVPGQVPPLGGGYPDPPSPPCGQTNTCENSTFPSYYVRGR